jgi:hypothetical protein
MPAAEVQLTFVDGRRQPLPDDLELVLSAIDGGNRARARLTLRGQSRVALKGLPVHGTLADQYTLLASARHHTDAGFVPVPLTPDAPAQLALMMLRRDARPAFDPFPSFVASRPGLYRFLTGVVGADAAAGRYDQLRREQPLALACLLNITTALEQMQLVPFDGLSPVPLQSFVALADDIPPARDRIFAWVDARLVAQFQATVAAAGANGCTRVVRAPAGMHQGATCSFKQVDFGEGNVQLSFHE